MWRQADDAICRFVHELRVSNPSRYPSLVMSVHRFVWLLVGLKRRGTPPEVLQELKAAYLKVYHAGNPRAAAVPCGGTPAALIVPTVALPPVTLFTLQVTAVLVVFVTVAAKACEAEGAMVTAAGET